MSTYILVCFVLIVSLLSVLFWNPVLSAWPCLMCFRLSDKSSPTWLCWIVCCLHLPLLTHLVYCRIEPESSVHYFLCVLPFFFLSLFLFVISRQLVFFLFRVIVCFILVVATFPLDFSRFFWLVLTRFLLIVILIFAIGKVKKKKKSSIWYFHLSRAFGLSSSSPVLKKNFLQQSKPNLVCSIISHWRIRVYTVTCPWK